MTKVKKLIENLKNNDGLAIVLGLGTTGRAAVNFFLNNNTNVVVIEKLSKEQFLLNASNRKYFQSLDKEITAKKLTINFEDNFSDNLKKLIADYQSKNNLVLAVISPGISLSSGVVQKIKSLNVQVIGELELALSLIDTKVVMVSGSNGKSTTVSLIHEILKESGINSFLCGNIGKPVLDVINEKIPPQVLVIEASSYQLEAAETVKPNVAVFLNLTPNHLERHGTIEKYRCAKMMMFKNQDKSDLAIFNFDDEIVFKSSSEVKSELAFFSNRSEISKSNYLKYAEVNFSPENKLDSIEIKFNDKKFLFDCTHSNLIGEHTRSNLAAATLAAIASGATEDAIKKVIISFSGLEHRMQKVPSNSGIFAINDSKSTTVASSVAALTSTRKNFPEAAICLLIGGKMKIGSWQPLCDAIANDNTAQLIRVICFGGDGPVILQEMENFGILATLARNVSEAVSLATDWIRKDEIVLFSPGCASFDEFQNFEKRGEAFSKLISLR